ncbi:acyl carrier protein [Halalkalibacterium halodurans]|uniref:acyl carrier protein n=1 Tax=Halalkalibacterium halodurans TaxID=86665 RepID=UPI001067AAF5|nr:acyl carrier protein [Halalkalibacterium halodurans]TES55753.1 acyl carrier protein [Halalkalibacterium halodurans]
MKILKEDLKELIVEIIEEEDLQDTDHFVDDLGVDSMMAIEIVAQIEKKYKITISEEYLPKVTSLNDVYEVVTNIVESTVVKEG